jgi:hypothetical protein
MYVCRSAECYSARFGPERSTPAGVRSGPRSDLSLSGFWGIDSGHTPPRPLASPDAGITQQVTTTDSRPFGDEHTDPETFVEEAVGCMESAADGDGSPARSLVTASARLGSTALSG